MEPNSMYFSKEQVKAGEMTEFLNVLLKQCYGTSEYYNDIHIKPEDCGAFTVEWVNVPWDHSFGGGYQYIEEDQCVMTDYIFPDNHYELCYDEEDFKERLDTFLKENPGWVKTSYGTWTNEIENEKMRKEFEKEMILEFDDVDEVVKPKEYHCENGIPQGE